MQMREDVVKLEFSNQFDLQSAVNTYASVLKECTRTRSLKDGKTTHSYMVMDGLEKSLVLANHLIDMYGKCGHVGEAQHTFDKMQERNVFSWMAILSAFVDHGHVDEALTIYKQSPGSVTPDKYLFVVIFKACAASAALDCGYDAHCQMVKLGTDVDAFVESALINMYIKCGMVDDACNTFNKTRERNVVLWNTMILGYVQQANLNKAGKLYESMIEDGFLPDNVTYVGVLQVCASMKSLKKAQQHHSDLVVGGYDSDLTVSNTLVDTYGKCGSIYDAWGVFLSMRERDIVSWNVIITAHVQQGAWEKAILLFEQMKQDGVKPNETTFVSVLRACTLLNDTESGVKFHEEAAKTGCELNTHLASTLVDMYAKGGRIKDAHEVFCSAKEQNVVVWTAMITGYVQQGYGDEALGLYQKMVEGGVKPNEVTLMSVRKACSIVGAVEKGQQFHEYVHINNLKANTAVMNSILEMYMSCGTPNNARVIFDEIPEPDVMSWTALIGGYVQQGLTREALTLFGQMVDMSVKPNAVTFVSILSACSHAGLIDGGCYYFYAMICNHGIAATLDHYACMVDLLGKAAQLQEAAVVVLSMEGQQTELVWRTLLGACKTKGSEGLANLAMEQLLQINPDNNAAYVMMLNLYGGGGSGTELNHLGFV